VRKKIICLAILVLVGFLFFPMVTPTLGNQNKFSSYSEDHNSPFYRVASDFLNSQGTVLPQLQNSHPVSPLVYNDKDGEDRVLVYGVEKEGKIIGRIVVNFDLDNPCFLEFAEVAPPHLLNVKQEVLSKALLEEGKILGEPKFVYDFPLLYYIHFDILRNGQKVSELWYFYNEGRIVSSTEIPEQNYQIATANQGGSIAPMYYYGKVLSEVPAYIQPGGLPNSCGPVAGAMILSYWARHGFSSLQYSWDKSNGIDLYTCLYADMATGNFGFTWPGEFRSGIEHHANTYHDNRNYPYYPQSWNYRPSSYYCSYHFTTNSAAPSFEGYCNEIDLNRPMGILINWNPWTWHWITGIGYSVYNTTRTMVVRDGWSSGYTYLYKL
jgi:hypothetical protein